MVDQLVGFKKWILGFLLLLCKVCESIICSLNQQVVNLIWDDAVYMFCSNLVGAL
jgi:hypothetical protein